MESILDRLFNEYSPQGAPPATEAAISSCEKIKIDEEVDEDEICAICRDEYELDEEVIKLHCSHFFHEDCVRPWLEKHNTCPICRTHLEEISDSQEDIFAYDEEFEDIFEDHSLLVEDIFESSSMEDIFDNSDVYEDIFEEPTEEEDYLGNYFNDDFAYEEDDFSYENIFHEDLFSHDENLFDEDYLEGIFEEILNYEECPYENENDSEDYEMYFDM
eukprot:TRINITY_DN819_c0_g1_i2.p2 TRINITY_DN819_c0_g1~~TRINITY_DN819_c0_g1_i2.p2  ORF type:complete len:217 (-),score=66.03 TRINITY_DN819_c0_g1_i2:108-758(-)